MTKAPLRAASALAIAAALVVAQPALADGVPAGTLIENTASATYTDGGAPQTVTSNTVTVQVDELLDVTVVNQDAGAVTIGNGSAVLEFQVTNTGNGPEAFVLTANPNVAGNDFNVTVDGIAVDTNGNGVYDPGVDQLLGAGATTAEIPADGSVTVFVLVTAPAGVADGDTSQVNLLAEAVTGTGAPGTLFPGAGAGGSDAVAGASGADDDAPGSLLAAIASLTLVKSAVVSDPFGGTQPVPGATITYTIRASVSGTGTLTDVRVTDATPAGTSYVPSSLKLNGSPLTDPAGDDAGEASAAGIAVTIPSAAAGSQRDVTFDVKID